MYLKNRKYKKNDIDANYFKSLIKTVPVCFYVKDLKGNIILANHVFSEVTGYTEKELVKMNVKDIFKDVHFSEIYCQDTEILRTRQAVNIEGKITFKENQTHNYWILKTPVFDIKNEITGFMVVFRNIDKEKEAQETKSSFVATLTHDLKSPANAQISMLNLLINGGFGELNAKQKEIAGLVRCSCKYVSELVSTIVSTYSCDFGQIVLKPEEFDIIVLISAVKTGLENLAGEKGQNIEFSYADKKCTVFADRLQIKRVIVNLISNAITYGFENSMIKINLASDKEMVYFTIENYSKPIPESELDIIFDRFKKSKYGPFNKTGTGLGLYLSKQIINLHKGNIFAKSYDDGKCVFSFEIPVNQDSHICIENIK